jgi:GT2 family glycosyltransferase
VRFSIRHSAIGGLLRHVGGLLAAYRSLRTFASAPPGILRQGALIRAHVHRYPRRIVDEPIPSAPPVVAVVVAHRPGPWFDEVLDGLAAQDYPNFQVVVLATGDGTEADPEGPEAPEALAARLGTRLPGAYLRVLDDNPGFGPAANEVMRLVEGSGFFCFLHDDVVLEPDAVRLLVEELYRSNAGIVGPKLLDWDDPDRLQAVGYSVDKFGELAPIAEPGDLDQEQHDGVRDVFCVPSACLLVRTDLFRVLGGFDPDIRHKGDALDLCWRAHVSGARVLVVPAAVGRHRGALSERVDVSDREAQREAERNRLRTVLASYTVPHLVRVVPQYAVVSGVEAGANLVTGHLGRASALLAAWGGALGGLGVRRRQVKAVRQVADADVRRLQVRGSAKFRRFLRGRGENEERFSGLQTAGRNVMELARSGTNKGVVAVWAAVLAVLLVGSRGLLTGGLPMVGTLLPEPVGGPGALVRSYLDGWWRHGLGSAAAAPAGGALAGLIGLASLGATGLVRTLTVVGSLVLGGVGAWRLTRPFGAGRARAAGLVAYVAVPVGLNAAAAGDLAGLLAYAATPWVLARIARLSNLSPWGDDGGEPGPGVPARPLVAQVAGLGLLVGAVSAFVPVYPLVVAALAVSLVVGSLVAGGTAGSIRALAGTLAASFLGLLLLLPWTAALSWADVVPLPPSPAADLAEVARFGVSTFSSPLTYGVLLAALVPLLIGRGWRLAWAGRALPAAVGFLAVAWVAGRDDLPVASPSVLVLLAPAAALLTLAVACGGAASVFDVQGARLGWRQPVSLLSVAGLGLAALPVLGWAADGRWDLPTLDHRTPLSLVSADPDDGDFRTLWVGDPRVLPLPGWSLDDSVAYALSDGVVPDLADTWLAEPGQGEQLVADALVIASTGRTTRLGAMLAPMGIRYVVLTTSAAPAAAGLPQHPLPSGVTSAMAVQLDLERTELDDTLVVYENTQWIPVRSQLSPGAAEASEEAGFEGLVSADLQGSAPVLPLDRAGVESSATGTLPAGTTYLAVPSDGSWSLTVGGERLVRRPAFGWANAFEVAEPGDATLEYGAPATRTAAVGLQAAGWVLVAAVALLAGRRRRRIPEPGPAAPEGPVLLHLGPGGDTRSDAPAEEWAEPAAGEEPPGDDEVESVEPVPVGVSEPLPPPVGAPVAQAAAPGGSPSPPPPPPPPPPSPAPQPAGEPVDDTADDWRAAIGERPREDS